MELEALLEEAFALLHSREPDSAARLEQLYQTVLAPSSRVPELVSSSSSLSLTPGHRNPHSSQPDDATVASSSSSVSSSQPGKTSKRKGDRVLPPKRAKRVKGES